MYKRNITSEKNEKKVILNPTQLTEITEKNEWFIISTIDKN